MPGRSDSRVASTSTGRPPLGSVVRVRRSWKAIVEESARFTRQHSPVTLRQAFYHLVSQQLIPNTPSAYKQLSDTTKSARKLGTHPAFIDTTRQIHEEPSFKTITQGVRGNLSNFHLDRTQYQPERLAIVCEKRGHAAALWRDIGKYQWPTVESGGNSSATIRDDLNEYDIDTILYVGDYDPSGLSIERTWRDHFPHVDFVRVALTLDQIDEFGLVKLAGKPTDSNAKRFTAEHGELFQVEVDAIPPDELRRLVRTAIEERMDLSMFDQVVAEENRQRDDLNDLLADFDGDTS